MTPKPKLEVIEITLGIDPLNSKEPIKQETAKKIEKIIEIAVKEKQAIEDIRLRPEQVEKAFSILYSKLNETAMNPLINYISTEHLLDQTNAKNLSVLIQSINKFIKSRGDIWTLKKKTVNGKTAYYLHPNKT